MTTIAFWLIVGAFFAAFLYELSGAILELDRPAQCHHCGETRRICPESTECVGEPCCHRCGRLMHDVDTGAQICPHNNTAT